MNLRVNDLNFETGILTVHDGKGKKDRPVPLPEKIIPENKKPHISRRERGIIPDKPCWSSLKG